MLPLSQIRLHRGKRHLRRQRIADDAEHVVYAPPLNCVVRFPVHRMQIHFVAPTLCPVHVIHYPGKPPNTVGGVVPELGFQKSLPLNSANCVVKPPSGALWFKGCATFMRSYGIRKTGVATISENEPANCFSRAIGSSRSVSGEA